MSHLRLVLASFRFTFCRGQSLEAPCGYPLKSHNSPTEHSKENFNPIEMEILQI